MRWWTSSEIFNTNYLHHITMWCLAELKTCELSLLVKHWITANNRTTKVPKWIDIPKIKENFFLFDEFILTDALVRSLQVMWGLQSGDPSSSLLWPLKTFLPFSQLSRGCLTECGHPSKEVSCRYSVSSWGIVLPLSFLFWRVWMGKWRWWRICLTHLETVLSSLFFYFT